MVDQNESLRAHVVRGSKWTAISAIAGGGLQLAQLAVLGRLLEPSDFGLMAMMMVAIGLGNAIADFGLGNYLVQSEELCQRALNRLLLTALAMSVAMAGAVALSASAAATYYQAPQLSIMLPWLSMAIVGSTLSQMLLALLQRAFEFKTIAVGEIASVLTALILAILLAMAGCGVWALVAGQLAAGASRLLVFLPKFLNLRRGLPIGGHGQSYKVGGFIFFQTGERLLNYVGWNMDKLILGRFAGDIALGTYTVAYQLMIRPFSVLNPIFTRVALPLFSRIKSDDARLISGYLQMLQVIAVLSFPIYVGISIAAPGITFLVMGQKWADSAPVLALLSVMGMFFSIGNPIGVLALAKGKPQWTFYSNLVSLLVYTLAFTIGAQFGVMGVAWAFVLAGVFILFPMEFLIRYLLVGMVGGQYLKALMHLFIAAVLPLFAHGIWLVLRCEALGPWQSLFWGCCAMLFFYSYVWLFDRPVLIGVKNLILKGR